ncbi:cupin domain-containing protein [Planctomycetota bacterium]
MFVRDLDDCEEFTAGDNCFLRELFNPHRDNLELRYSLAHATVKPSEITYRHRLKNSEVYYILAGEGLMYIDAESRPVKPGQAVYIPPNSIQRIKNTGSSNLVFLCLVDPAWQPDDEEVLED